MSSKRMDEHLTWFDSRSEALFGEPAEVEAAEAEELLKAAGIDPVQLRSNLHRRMVEQSESYGRAGKPLPPLLEKGVRDFESHAKMGGDESHALRAIRLHVRQLLTEIKNLPNLLGTGMAPTFATAYRNRRELSARDKKTLDKIAAELKRKTDA